MTRKSWLITGAIILIAIAAGIGGYFSFNHGGGLSSSDTSTSTDSVPIVTSTPSDWLSYSNSTFGISLKYPPQATVCELPQLQGEEASSVLDLDISISGNCNATTSLSSGSSRPGDIYIHIQPDPEDTTVPDKNLNSDFYKDFGGIDAALNPNLGYFTLDGFDAYGGIVKRLLPATPSSLEYIFEIRQGGHYISFWDMHYDVHEEDTNIIINSLSFDSAIYQN